ncbi:hypothetical protein CS542_10775 [Pedobacter sp. IW39]|nr:hypothetical protein CS542_10775 [Pedobacter sp. IW39]
MQFINWNYQVSILRLLFTDLLAFTGICKNRHRLTGNQNEKNNNIDCRISGTGITVSLTQAFFQQFYFQIQTDLNKYTSLGNTIPDGPGPQRCRKITTSGSVTNVSNQLSSITC